MARGVNKALLIGNLGRDIELRYAQSGQAVANFSIATTEKVKKGGEWEDQTEWHNIVVFGKTAEACNQFLAKGSAVYIEGKIQTRKWQDKNGNDRYTTEIIGNNVQFLSPKGEGGNDNHQDNQEGGGFPG